MDMYAELTKWLAYLAELGDRLDRGDYKSSNEKFRLVRTHNLTWTIVNSMQEIIKTEKINQ